jgi:hypothetical protein
LADPMQSGVSPEKLTLQRPVVNFVLRGGGGMKFHIAKPARILAQCNARQRRHRGTGEILCGL